jgi:hypothetical protein
MINGRALQEMADAWLVEGDAARWNQALMDYGARVCTSRPKCDECVVARWCASREARPAAARSMVAEERVPYVARPLRSKKAEVPFEESARYARGRIVDALRVLPRGCAIAVGELRASIAVPAGIDDGVFDSYIDALARAGLLVRRECGCVSLPD